VGVELHEDSVKNALERLATSSSSKEVIQDDFFAVDPQPDFDAVLGNPPYIRYQHFFGDVRERGLRAALAAGVNLSGLSSSWAPFLIHASRFLKADGRLGMVLPAELLSVSYAGPVRRFLLQRFAKIRIVVFERLIFEDALEDVVLLMASGSGGCDRIEVVQVRDAADLASGATTLVSAKDLRDDKWVATLVRPDAWEAFTTVAESPHCEKLIDWGSPYLGVVTGDNDYFCLSDAQVKAASLDDRDLLRVSPPGSRHLRSLEFGQNAWASLRADGRRVWLFYPRPGKLSKASIAYVEVGEKRGVNKGYKCRMREDWWRVPLVQKPDLLLTYMDHERPRLVTNAASAQHLNSLYGVRLKRGRKQIGSQLLPLATLNTVSLLGAEVHGRAYGGGLLKLEPRDADRIPVPSLAVIQASESALDALRPQVAYALDRGDLARAVSLVDGVLWEKNQMTPKLLETLRQAREALFQRRHSRGRGAAVDE
jgi:hypothetical protein